MATLLIGLVGAATAGVAPSVRVSPAPRTVEVGATWSTVLTVRLGGTPYRGPAPRMTAQRGTVTRAFALRRVRPGSYRASLAVDSPGRWAVSVLVAGKKLRIGTLLATPALTNAVDVAVLPSGRLLVADLSNHVYAAAARGALTVVAGNGRSGASGDGGPATAAAVGFPIEVAVDPGGGFAVVQRDRVRHIGANGTITTVGLFDGPTALAYDADGNLFVSEITGRIRRVAGGTGAVSTYAGSDAGFGGDGGPATDALLDQPHGLAIDAEGNLFVCDVGNHRIRRVDRRTGVITTVAADLSVPVDAAVAPDGSLYVADFGGNRVARVANGTVTTVVAAAGPNSIAVDQAPRCISPSGRGPASCASTRPRAACRSFSVADPYDTGGGSATSRRPSRSSPGTWPPQLRPPRSSSPRASRRRR